MADDTASDHGHGHDRDSDADIGQERITAPMSDFSGRQAGIGFLAFLVGAAIAFGVPGLLTL